MPTFDVDCERINVFELENFFVFKQYFELDEVFDHLREFYNGEEYRFEVSEDSLEEVRKRLADHYYELKVVENVEPFTVVKRRYSDHPELLFRNAVERWSQGDYHVFVLKDQLAVEQAVNQGAKRLSETDFES